MKRSHSRAASKQLSPDLPIHPSEQAGMRLTPEQLEQARLNGDVHALRREGGYAIDKGVWLVSPEQRDRPDLAERLRSAAYTLAVTHAYVRQGLGVGGARLDGGDKGRRTRSQECEARDRAVLDWVAARKWRAGKLSTTDEEILRDQAGVPGGRALVLRTLQRMRGRHREYWQQLKARFKVRA